MNIWFNELAKAIEENKELPHISEDLNDDFDEDDERLLTELGKFKL